MSRLRPVDSESDDDAPRGAESQKLETTTTGDTGVADALAGARPPDPADLPLAQARVGAALFGINAAGAFGRFRVLERLGAGGMGVVFAAYDPDLDRGVALKLVNVPGRSREIALAEARALARLSHPNVVPVHDVGAEGPYVYIVLELVRGETLDRWAKNRSQRQVIDAYRQAGEGLQAAHSAGLVHRDFKPSNVLIGRDGRVRVVDFGLACEAARPGDDPRGSREVAGTPRYMAPEQAARASVAAAADQYSFSVALSEALTEGGRPLPRWLESILKRGRAADPSARFPSMRELLRALSRDPARMWRWRIGAASFITACAIAFAVGRSAVEARDDVCGEGGARLASAWPPEKRGASLAQIASLGAYGRTLAPWLELRLRDYGEQWAGGFRDACLSRLRHLQSDTLVDHRVACLERGRVALSSVASIVETADVATLPDVALAVRALPEVERCADLDVQLADVEPPRREIADRVAKLRDEIDRARVQLAAGRFEQARSAVSSTLAEARAIGYRPLIVESLLTEGHAAMDLGLDEQAMPLLDEATTAAIEVGAEALAVEAWARRAWVQGTNSHGEAALAGLGVMEALAARPRSGLFARALLYNNVGGVELARDQRDQARRHYQQALELAAGVTGPGAVELVNVRMNLGLVTDDLDERDRLLAGAATEMTRLLGSDHPQTLQARWVHGVTTPSLARALELLVSTCEAVDIHPTLGSFDARCWAEIGYLRYELGDLAGAVTAMERAVGTDEQRLSASPEAMPYLLLWRRDAVGAARAFRAALATIHNEPADESWFARFALARLELGLGRALRAAGQLRAATTPLASSVDALASIARKHPTADIERRLGRAQIELALTLAKSGAPQREVAPLAAAGIAWLQRVGGSAPTIHELAEWARK